MHITVGCNTSWKENNWKI